MAPKAEFMKITPAIADEMLESNNNNRPFRQGHAMALARDMKAGDWKVNGEAVKFNKSGTLIDGQHRLAAVILSETTVEMLVIKEVDDGTQYTLDSGAKRTLSDTLRFQGESNTQILAAGLRQALLWKLAQEKGGKYNYTSKITNAEMLKYLEKNPEMRDYARRGQTLSRNANLPGGIAVLLQKLFYDIDQEDADTFFERLASDEGHYKGEPIYALRKALADTSKSALSTTKSAQWKLALSIKAWNKYRLGEEVKVLSWRPGGARPEAFPTPV